MPVPKVDIVSQPVSDLRSSFYFSANERDIGNHSLVFGPEDAVGSGKFLLMKGRRVPAKEALERLEFCAKRKPGETITGLKGTNRNRKFFLSHASRLA